MAARGVARGGGSVLPGLVRPMLATPGQLPPARDDERWAYELKWDGIRAVGYAEGGELRLVSRNDLDITAGYPEVLPLAGTLGGTAAVLDGELVAFDDRGVPRFGRLQERMHVRDPAAARRLAESVPVFYIVFDVLQLDATPTLELPYTDRRRILEDLDLNGPSWQTPPSYRGSELGGAEMLAASRENGMEGVLAKRLESRYRPGKRSPDWLKVKHERAQEVVVAGWRPGRGRRAGGIGALIMGVYGDDGELRYSGGVGTGFTEHALADLAKRLAPLARDTPPFAHPLTASEARDAHWVRPELVGEVAYTEWTHDHRIRHPAWRGLRPDKSPAEVHREDG